jgi:hypothetical protein
MINRKRFKYLPGLALAVAIVSLAVSSGGCSAANTVAAAAMGCDEFSGGASSVANLSVDVNTKAFLTASLDLVGVSGAVETDVFNACSGIATDLGVADTWTAKAAKDDQVNEACTQASTKIQAILAAGAQAQVTCSLGISGGQCTVDASAEATCTASCTGAVNCMPPDVTVNCEPGELSVQCSGMCMAGATCEGTVTTPVLNCQGVCDADCSGECDGTATAHADCQGSCSGTCFGTCNGTATGASGMANCAGTCMGKCDAKCTIAAMAKVHCSGSCKGTCTGNCKIDGGAMVMCGATVSCKGGCMGTATLPRCEGTLTPPSCMADANCAASCQSHAEVTAVCTKPTATLDCLGTTTGVTDLDKLVATLKTNMPLLANAFQTQGPLALKAAGKVKDTGAALVASVGTLSGKAIACATTAASASAKASLSVSVSVMASANVSGSCGGPTS